MQVNLWVHNNWADPSMTCTAFLLLIGGAVNRLNRKVEYALMALKYMSGKYAGELTTAKEISEHTGCPFDATARVMQQMAQKGLLKSEQGAHGGYLLIKDLSRVSFYELIEMILGPLGIVKCLHNGGDCDLTKLCQIQAPLEVLNQKLIEFYTSLSMKELLSDGSPICVESRQDQALQS